MRTNLEKKLIAKYGLLVFEKALKKITIDSTIELTKESLTELCEKLK